MIHSNIIDYRVVLASYDHTVRLFAAVGFHILAFFCNICFFFSVHFICDQHVNSNVNERVFALVRSSASVRPAVPRARALVCCFNRVVRTMIRITVQPKLVLFPVRGGGDTIATSSCL